MGLKIYVSQEYVIPERENRKAGYVLQSLGSVVLKQSNIEPYSNSLNYIFIPGFPR